MKEIQKKTVLKELLEAGVHFGHKAHRWHPKMFPYIYTEKNHVHIIDLIQTYHLLKKTCKLVEEATKKNKTVLFVATKRQAAPIIEKEAIRCGSYYINHRWLGGMLTNWTTIYKRIQYLNELEQRDKEGLLDLLPKKEAIKKKKELNRLHRYFDGVKNMDNRPDIIFVIDQKREMIAIKEARSLNIPIISILDTNCNPDLITYPIPGNDDGIRSIKYIVEKIADSICLAQ